MAYSHDAFTRDEKETRERLATRENLQRDQKETRDGSMDDGLTQTIKVARESKREQERARESQGELERARKRQRGDMKIFRHIDD